MHKNGRVESKLQKGGGFTLLELMAIVGILGVLVTLVIPRVFSAVVEAKISKTKEKAALLSKAITGDVSSMSGYELDVGALPSSLSELLTKPAGVSMYDPFTKKGWNGPYIKEAKPGDYLLDGWSNSFIYDKNARTIKSYGADGASGGTGDDTDITSAF